MVDLGKLGGTWKKELPESYVPLKETAIGKPSEIVSYALRLMEGEHFVIPVNRGADDKLPTETATALRLIARALSKRNYKLARTGDDADNPTKIALSAKKMTKEEKETISKRKNKKNTLSDIVSTVEGKPFSPSAAGTQIQTPHR